MRRIAIIAEASVREHARRKLLAFFAIGSLLVMGLLLYATKDSTGKLLAGTGTTAAVFITSSFYQLFALAAALATSMGAIGAPIGSGEALPILARPISRDEWALGRILGSLVPVAGLCALFAIETQIIAVVSGGNAMSTLWEHWAVSIFNLSVVVALVTLVSALVSAPVLAAIIGFVTYQVVGLVSTLHRLVQIAELKGGFTRIIQAVYYVTPKFLTSPLNPRTGQAARFIVHNTVGLEIWAVAYLLGLVAATLVLARRREV